MLQRSVVIAISAVLGIMLGPLEASASGTSHFGGSAPRNGSETWIAGSRWSGQGHWSKKSGATLIGRSMMIFASTRPLNTSCGAIEGPGLKQSMAWFGGPCEFAIELERRRSALSELTK